MNEEELDKWYDSKLAALEEKYLYLIADKKADKEELNKGFQREMVRLRAEYEKKSEELIRDEQVARLFRQRFHKMQTWWKKISSQFRE